MTTRARSHQTHPGTPEDAAEVASGAAVAVDEGLGVEVAEAVDVGVTAAGDVRVGEVDEVEGRWLELELALSDCDGDEEEAEDVGVDDAEGADVLDSRPPSDRVVLG